VVVAGVVFATLVVAMALLADVLAPHPPDEPNWELVEAPPGARALFGTDRLGRDVLSRVIHGARIPLYVATVSIAVAMLAGGTLGLAAGYAGGAWGNLINRVERRQHRADDPRLAARRPSLRVLPDRVAGLQVGILLGGTVVAEGRAEERGGGRRSTLRSARPARATGAGGGAVAVRPAPA
jgi:hypothetical protein